MAWQHLGVSNELLTLAAFLGTDLDLQSVSDRGVIASTIIRCRHEMSDISIARTAERHAQKAAILEQGEEYEDRIWNHDHWLVYDITEPTADNIRRERWISEALSDPALADRFLARMPSDELEEIRRRVEASYTNPSE